MSTIKNALEELNYLVTGDLTDDEFQEKFKVNPNTRLSHCDLNETGKISQVLEVSHKHLVHGLIIIYKK